MNEYQKALEDAKTCIKLNPTFPKGTLRLGDAQLQLSHFNDAMASYGACLSSGDQAVAQFAITGQQNVNIKV